MEFLKRAKVFRLKCEHHDKYLSADQDEERVIQSKDINSTRSCWAMEEVEGKPNLIRLRSGHCWKYLAATDERFLTGKTGSRVALRLRLDSSVEWEPIKEGPYIKLKSHVGTFLRANRGTYPWRNTVTHDQPDHWTAKQNMLLWIVDIVELQSVPSSVQDDVDVSSSSNAMDHKSVSGYSSEDSTQDYDDDDDDDESSESFGKLKAMLAEL